MNDTIKMVVIGIVLSWAIFLMCGIYIGKGCNKCTEIVTTITPPVVNHDTTPDLPNIVVKPKPRLTASKFSKDSTPLHGMDSTLIALPLPPVGSDSGILKPEPLSYCTFKRYPDGDSIAAGVSSSILPLDPPVDWKWHLDRFKVADTSKLVVKNKHFGIGITAGAGYGGQQIARKSYVPDVQITVGFTWMP